MPLIRVYWHFNCWRPILNLQNLNLLGAGELKCYICHFLWSGIPLAQPQGQPHLTGKGFPPMGRIHQITECFLLKARSFFRSSKEALSISHVIANTPTASPDCLCPTHIPVLNLFFWNFCPLLFFPYKTNMFLSPPHYERVSKQASNETLLVFLRTQQTPFRWPRPFETCIMAFSGSSSSNYLFNTSWCISLHRRASQQNLSGILPASRAEFIHVQLHMPVVFYLVFYAFSPLSCFNTLISLHYMLS